MTCKDSLDRVILKLRGTSKRLEGCKGKGVAGETPLACSLRRLKSRYLLVQPLLHKSGFRAALVLISKTSVGLYGEGGECGGDSGGGGSTHTVTLPREVSHYWYLWGKGG